MQHTHATHTHTHMQHTHATHTCNTHTCNTHMQHTHATHTCNTHMQHTHATHTCHTHTHMQHTHDRQRDFFFCIFLLFQFQLYKGPTQANQTQNLKPNGSKLLAPPGNHFVVEPVVFSMASHLSMKSVSMKHVSLECPCSNFSCKIFGPVHPINFFWAIFLCKKMGLATRLLNFMSPVRGSFGSNMWISNIQADSFVARKLTRKKRSEHGGTPSSGFDCWPEWPRPSTTTSGFFSSSHPGGRSWRKAGFITWPEAKFPAFGPTEAQWTGGASGGPRTREVVPTKSSGTCMTASGSSDRASLWAKLIRSTAPPPGPVVLHAPGGVVLFGFFGFVGFLAWLAWLCWLHIVPMLFVGHSLAQRLSLSQDYGHGECIGLCF